MVRKVELNMAGEALQKDLGKYRQMALDLGAADARVITAAADMVIVEDRVRAKCLYPKCGSYGTNANCPPYTMDLEQFRRVIADYRHAVFFKLEVPPQDVAGPQVNQATKTRGQLKVHEIVSKIESAAFYDGYSLALGFGNGSCKRLFCPNDDCSALVPGKACRHPLRGRPSMEAMGMNVFAMSNKVGWDVYPLGRNMSTTEGVPYATRAGLVLVC